MKDLREATERVLFIFENPNESGTIILSWIKSINHEIISILVIIFWGRVSPVRVEEELVMVGAVRIKEFEGIVRRK